MIQSEVILPIIFPEEKDSRKKTIPSVNSKTRFLVFLSPVSKYLFIENTIIHREKRISRKYEKYRATGPSIAVQSLRITPSRLYLKGVAIIKGNNNKKIKNFFLNPISLLSIKTEVKYRATAYIRGSTNIVKDHNNITVNGLLVAKRIKAKIPQIENRSDNKSSNNETIDLLVFIIINVPNSKAVNILGINA
jgi:hypothetical protein